MVIIIVAEPRLDESVCSSMYGGHSVKIQDLINCIFLAQIMCQSVCLSVRPGVTQCGGPNVKIQDLINFTFLALFLCLPVCWSV